MFSRTGLTQLLTLLVPALLTASWAWLVYGGVIADAESAERTDRQRCLATGERMLAQQWSRAAADASFWLPLDAERHVLSAFGGRPNDTPNEGKLGIAESAANARLARGDAAGALPFFAHAYGQGQLSALGSLVYADQLRANDEVKADQVLARASKEFGGTWCGPLPFDLLSALRRLRHGSRNRDADLDTVFAASQKIAPSAVPAITAQLRTLLPNEPRVAELTAAAIARAYLGDRPAPTKVHQLPDGILLLPSGDDAIVALPAAKVTQHLAAAERATSQSLDGLLVAMPNPDRASWRVTRTNISASALLTIVANASLGLAIVTFALGNLLLWRLSRRELALVRLRRDFVDVVSHELRTPLAALSLKAEMLANGDVPPNRREHYLRTLEGDVHRLTDQVERILDFGRLERGAPLQRERLPARAMLARGLRAGRPALRLVQQQLDVAVPRSLPAVNIDVDVLTRALRNLLENAAKYAPQGSTVAVRAFATGSTITIEVADTGPGVDPAERSAIFQPFVRAGSATADIPGSGLGLALVAAAAKAHGGKVDVRERPGGGAVFTMTLPIAKESAS